MTGNSNKTKSACADAARRHYAAGDLIGQGDLTWALIELLQVPKTERDDDWHKIAHRVRDTLNEILTKVREELII